MRRRTALEGHARWPDCTGAQRSACGRRGTRRARPRSSAYRTMEHGVRRGAAHLQARRRLSRSLRAASRWTGGGILMRAFVLAIVMIFASAGGYCADYPSKPVRLVVPFPAGGTTDVMGRLIGQQLSARLGQQFIIDNRPGAAGGIGADVVAKAPGDGYTLLLGAVATHSINPSLYARLPYDPVKDFEPISLVGTLQNVLVVNPSVPARSVQDL